MTFNIVCYSVEYHMYLSKARR